MNYRRFQAASRKVKRVEPFQPSNMSPKARRICLGAGVLFWTVLFAANAFRPEWNVWRIATILLSGILAASFAYRLLLEMRDT